MFEIFDELNGDFGNTTLRCLDTISPTMQSIVVHSEPNNKSFSSRLLGDLTQINRIKCG